MPNYSYTDNIPFATNNPSDDQPNMQTNTNSIDSIIGEDHFSFNDNNGGLHQKTRLVNQPGIPAGVATGMGTLYTKTVATSASTNESTLFYVPDGTINQYQLTRTIAPKGSSFAKVVSNTSGSLTFNRGWTFLPGGLLLNYGSIVYSATSAGSVTTTYIVPFTTDLFTISVDFIKLTSVSLTSADATSFKISPNGTVAGSIIYWSAIGK